MPTAYAFLYQRAAKPQPKATIIIPRDSSDSPVRFAASYRNGPVKLIMIDGVWLIGKKARKLYHLPPTENARGATYD